LYYQKGGDHIKTKIFTFKIDPKAHKKLKKLAAKENRSMSNIVQHLVDKHLILKEVK